MFLSKVGSKLDFKRADRSRRRKLSMRTLYLIDEGDVYNNDDDSDNDEMACEILNVMLLFYLCVCTTSIV